MHDLEATSTTLPNRFNAIESIGDVVVSVELLCLEILSATWRGQKNGGKIRESLGKLRDPPLLSLLMQVLNSLSKEIVGRGIVPPLIAWTGNTYHTQATSCRARLGVGLFEFR